MTALHRRHLLGAAGAFATTGLFGPELWAQARDRLVIGISLEPPVLDPNKNAAASIRELTCPNIFESLGRINRTGAIGPGLAESWTISPDGKEYVFKLHTGVKFHDGEALDASVVKFTIDRLFAANSAVPAKSLYTDIDKVEAVEFGDGQDHAEVAQLLPALQSVAGRRGHHASQVGRDQRQASDRHRPLRVQGTQGG